MSLSEVSVRSNSFSDKWHGARAVIEEELRAISKALERIRISSQLQDEVTEHLLAVHRQWCEACPPAAAGGHRGGGPLEKEAQAAAAHTSKNPQKHVPTSTETTNIGLQMNVHVVGEVDDNDDDIGEPSVPLSMIWCQDEETQSDVTRTLQEASAEKVGHSTTFIKVEAVEDDQYPDTLLKLEKDHSDVDVDSSNMDTTSHQRHEEEEPSQHIESDVANNASSALTCHVLSPEGVSDDQISVGLDSNKRVQRTSRSDDGTTIQSSSLNCDVLSPEGVCDDQFSVGLDSNKRVQRTSRSDDGRNNTSSTLHCDALSPAGVSDDQFSVGLDSNKKVRKTSKSSGKMFSSVCSKSLSKKESVGTFMTKHNREKPFKCDLCGYQCSTKETLNVHMRTHSGAYQCSSCDKSFSRKWDMEHHMMMAHFHSGEKCFPCDYCSYSSNSKTHLQIHMRIHTREKPFKCDRCTYRSTTKQNLKIHMRVHTGERPHECSLCGKRFTQMSNLKSHMMIHTGQKPHQCSVCGKRFTKMGGLKRHMKTH